MFLPLPVAIFYLVPLGLSMSDMWEGGWTEDQTGVNAISNPPQDTSLHSSLSPLTVSGFAIFQNTQQKSPLWPLCPSLLLFINDWNNVLL